MRLKNNSPLSSQTKMCSSELRYNSWFPQDYETSIFDIYGSSELFGKYVEKVFKTIIFQQRLVKNKYVLTVRNLEKDRTNFNINGDHGVEGFATYMGEELFKRKR